MRVLIITTFFPPDTAIAAIRPYMFCKYLRQMGHQVTVMRSGEFIQKPDQSLPYGEMGINVYSYLGNDSPAENHANGVEADAPIHAARSGRFLFLPAKMRSFLIKGYNEITAPMKFHQFVDKVDESVRMQKHLIDRLHEDGIIFDVVLATYGRLENIYAGRYASTKFQAKFILDYRDIVASRELNPYWIYVQLKRIQKQSLKMADRYIAVSEGVAKALSQGKQADRISVIYNGYENGNEPNYESTKPSPVLSFCYTGTMHGRSRDASMLFKAIADFADQGLMSLDRVRFDYAGNTFEALKEQAERFGVSEILVNHGYMNREQVNRLQFHDDMFVVLTWNTKNEQGILTGKFYEALKNKKPVVALVSGSKPHSEIRKIVESNYLGVCYEAADNENTWAQFIEYILKQYESKIEGNAVLYEPKPIVFEKFEYSGITRQLEKVMKDLVNGHIDRQ